MARRKPANPTNPQAVAAIANAMHRISNNAPDLTPIEQRLSRRLAAGMHGHALNRIAARMQKLPPEQTKIFGPHGLTTGKPTAADRMRNILASINGVEKPDVILKPGPHTVPIGNTLDKFTVSYTGIYCQDESDWDRGSSSDEIYVLTSAIVAKPGQESSVTTLRHPSDAEYYGDFDTGNSRPSPDVKCWTGLENELCLTTTVMEHDEGDAEHYRAEVDSILTSVLDALESVQIPVPEMLKKFQALIVDTLAWLLGSEDDLIEVQNRRLTPEALRYFARAETQEYIGKRRVQTTVAGGGFGPPRFKTVEDKTGIQQHFVTRHAGGGATYVVGYKVSRKPFTFPATPVNS
jgi:hypothetical protein